VLQKYDLALGRYMCLNSLRQYDMNIHAREGMTGSVVAVPADLLTQMSCRGGQTAQSSQHKELEES